MTNASEQSVEVRMTSSSKFEVSDGKLYILAEGYRAVASASLEFDVASKSVAYGARDNFKFNLVRVELVSPGLVRLTGMPVTPKVGNVLTFRRQDRPDPAIWVSESKDVSVEDVTVRSALGMAFLAQRSEDILLDHFRVALAPGSPRYFTTGADAAHCSSCRGFLRVQDGLFENMFDDGLNVHGTYMRITEKRADGTLLLEWPHRQSFGFTFALPGEHLSLVRPDTLEAYASGSVAAVSVPDPHHVQVKLSGSLPVDVKVGDVVDNTDWYPTVTYARNIVRRNRSRGVLVKTPMGTVIEGNLFDHLSGPAILFEADAKTWFESRPAENVAIRGNTFKDLNIAGTSAGAIASRLAIGIKAEQASYLLRSIDIEGNHFSVFDPSILTMDSVSNLTFRNNDVVFNGDYAQPRRDDVFFRVRHASCVDIEGNELPSGRAGTQLIADDAKDIYSDEQPAPAQTCTAGSRRPAGLVQ